MILRTFLPLDYGEAKKRDNNVEYIPCFNFFYRLDRAINGNDMPSVFTEGIQLTELGGVANPRNIFACHFLHSRLQEVRSQRVRLFKTCKFTPAY